MAGADFPRAIARAKTLLSDGRLVFEIMRQFSRGVIHRMFATSVANIEIWLGVVSSCGVVMLKHSSSTRAPCPPLQSRSQIAFLDP